MSKYRIIEVVDSNFFKTFVIETLIKPFWLPFSYWSEMKHHWCDLYPKSPSVLKDNFLTLSYAEHQVNKYLKSDRLKKEAQEERKKLRLSPGRKVIEYYSSDEDVTPQLEVGNSLAPHAIGESLRPPGPHPGAPTDPPPPKDV